MVQFHSLVVTDVQNTTRDAVVVTLAPAPEAADAFAFQAGQYLTFRRLFDGQELRRSYSICSAPHEGALRVGIKRVPGGAFSTWANSQLSPGDRLEAMTPMGNFAGRAGPSADGEPEREPGGEPDEKAEARAPQHILAFAAGSGITPILSIIASALETKPKATVTLVYANRSPKTVMFRDALEDLKNRYMGRFNVAHVLSDASQEIELFSGRIDAEKCKALFDSWIDVSTVSTAYICGPEQMMTTVSDSLKAHGLAGDQIRFELFASSQPGRLPMPVKDTDEVTAGAGGSGAGGSGAEGSGAEGSGVPGKVTLGGDSTGLMVAAGASLLDAALANDVEAPYACRAGVCSTCKAKVTQGSVEMVANHALEDYEVDAGFVLTCQSYAVSDAPLAWSYDDAGH